MLQITMVSITKV